MSFLKRLFAKEPPTYAQTLARVRRGFQHRPGTLLWPAMVPELRAWFEPEVEEAEPKSLVRLFAGAMDGGTASGRSKGWSEGGGSSARSQANLQRLADLIGIPFSLYFQKDPGSDQSFVQRCAPLSRGPGEIHRG